MLEFNFFTLLYQFLRGDAIFFMLKKKGKDGIVMGQRCTNKNGAKQKNSIRTIC